MRAAITIRSLPPMGLSYLASRGSLITSSAAQLLTFAILARSLGVEEFSYFVGLTAITAVAVQLCGLGAQEAPGRPGPDAICRHVRPQHHHERGHRRRACRARPAGAAGIFHALAQSLAQSGGIIALYLLANTILTRVILLVEQAFIAHSMFAAANRNVALYAAGRLGGNRGRLPDLWCG
ncbi:MAG: hypothetical protein MO852_07980 [Candidatus Devosia euplotis]|nr:hypothetical protein [Candidatus Devosia euplotis]